MCIRDSGCWRECEYRAVGYRGVVDHRTAHGDEAGRRHRVVVIGSGFGGLFTTQSLKGADVDITVIAETTHHLFQPLLYQFATGILSEGEIAPATREILRRQRNARVLLGAVTDINLTEGTVTLPLIHISEPTRPY